MTRPAILVLLLWTLQPVFQPVHGADVPDSVDVMSADTTGPVTDPGPATDIDEIDAAKIDDDQAQKPQALRRVDVAEAEEMKAKAQAETTAEADPHDVHETGAGGEADASESTEPAVLLVSDADEDELDLDAASSINVVESSVGLYVLGDIRFGYFYNRLDLENGTSESSSLLRTRWRLEASAALMQGLRASARLAGRCSTEECTPNFTLDNAIPTSTSTKDGDITLDQLYLHWFRTERNNVAVGRLQTRFVARAGVFNKSLDRNDSNNVNINWTDGIHATARRRGGWVSHFIAQVNSVDGASSVRRRPLDFAKSASRVSYFVGFENLEPLGVISQRALDVSWLPRSLLVDGITTDEPVKDYWGLVGRLAARMPRETNGMRVRLASELGFAPITPTKDAVGLAGTGDASGLAWNIAVSLIDWMPKHSIGVNYGRTGAGWLLSPQYRANEELFEVRYVFKPKENLTIEMRARWRHDLEMLAFSEDRRDDFDIYARMTWRFNGRRFAPFWQ